MLQTGQLLTKIQLLYNIRIYTRQRSSHAQKVGRCCRCYQIALTSLVLPAKHQDMQSALDV
jgi:hypothetical protein